MRTLTTSSTVVEAEGTFEVTITDEFGCTITDSVVIVNTSNTNELIESLVKIYPNPANDFFIIENKEVNINNRFVWT